MSQEKRRSLERSASLTEVINMETMLVKATEIPSRTKSPVPVEKVSEAWVKVQKTEEKAARLEREAQEISESAEQVRHEAEQTLEEVLAPLRKQRQGMVRVTEERARQVAEITTKLERAQSLLTRSTKKLEDFDREVEDMGIPIVLLGAKRYHKNEHKYEGRTTIKPDMLDAFGPILISGPKRHGDTTHRCTIEISSDGEIYRARRIDGTTEESSVIESKRLSDVTTSPGWLTTKDVAFAILSYLHRTEEFPALRPVSDPKELEVNGNALA